MTALSLHPARGFTVIELMIVVAIVAILATVAMPSLQDMVVRMRMKTAAGDLHTSLLLARSEAIKRNATVTVNPIGGGTDWAVGWEVKDTGGTVLSRQDPYSGVTFGTLDAANAAIVLASLSFAGTGRCAIANCPGIAFVVTGTNYPSIAARCVLLDPSGRATVRVDKNGNSVDGCN